MVEQDVLTAVVWVTQWLIALKSTRMLGKWPVVVKMLWQLAITEETGKISPYVTNQTCR